MNHGAPPTPQEIARAFELWDEHLASVPENPRAGRAVAERIYRDHAATAAATTAGPEAAAEAQETAEEAEAAEPAELSTRLLDYIREMAEKGSVTNADRGPVRAFWSHESQPEGADRMVPHRFLARACGESRNLQVLEDTPVGHQLNSYHLDNAFVVDALARHFAFDKAELASATGAAWDTLSRHYAQAAEADVVAFVPDISATYSVLGRDEMPLLLRNENVGKDGVKFPVPLPRHEHLPADIDAFIAEPPVRSQLVMEDYDPEGSPEAFAVILQGIDVPEDRKQAHSAIVDRLSMAGTYQDLRADAPDPVRKAVLAGSFLPGMNVGHGIIPAARNGPAGHAAAASPAPAPPQPAPKPTGIEH
ncbi:hypothetical protein [Streptomyces sp. NPDC047014]|uniref:hypothetical protein n=1 Tax=Streptomyces sp. NPDC047014 TaxID=3155736 RepID=UPI0033ECEAE4